MYRVIIGMLIGLFFGLIIQAILAFPENSPVKPNYDKDGNITNPDFTLWAYQLNIWASFFKNIFINGVMLLTVPIVFIAIFKVVAKPTNRGVGKVVVKGLIILLINVAIAFTFTFLMGILFDVAGGQNLVGSGASKADGKGNIPLPQIIWEYIPKNFVGALAASSIIPVMVLGMLSGMSVRILSKRKSVEMEAIRKAMDTGWSIAMSMIMTFMKIMPLGVMSMITTSIVSNPIGQMAVIGKVIGIGYLGIVFAVALLTFEVFLSRISVSGWWKIASRPFIQGFATQSSNATLPVTMSTLKEDMKVSEAAVSSITPLSTSMGLIACAGVQAGLLTSVLWTGTGAGSEIHAMGIIPFFFIGLLVTLIASLGIAGVPGTATVVTVGVIGGLGFPMYIDPVLAIIAPLDGFFDMGRTAANVLGGAAVTPIVAKTEGMIEEGSPLLSPAVIFKQQQILEFNTARYQFIDNKMALQKQIDKIRANKELEKEVKDSQILDIKKQLNKLTYEYKVYKANQKFSAKFSYLDFLHKEKQQKPIVVIEQNNNKIKHLEDLIKKEPEKVDKLNIKIEKLINKNVILTKKSTVANEKYKEITKKLVEYKEVEKTKLSKHLDNLTKKYNQKIKVLETNRK